MSVLPLFGGEIDGKKAKNQTARKYGFAKAYPQPKARPPSGKTCKTSGKETQKKTQERHNPYCSGFYCQYWQRDKAGLFASAQNATFPHNLCFCCHNFCNTECCFGIFYSDSPKCPGNLPG